VLLGAAERFPSSFSLSLSLPPFFPRLSLPFASLCSRYLQLDFEHRRGRLTSDAELSGARIVGGNYHPNHISILEITSTFVNAIIPSLSPSRFFFFGRSTRGHIKISVGRALIPNLTPVIPPPSSPRRTKLHTHRRISRPRNAYARLRIISPECEMQRGSHPSLEGRSKESLKGKLIK